VRVGVVQGNIAPGQRGERAARTNVAIMGNLAAELLRQGPVDLMVWPEGSCWPSMSYFMDPLWQLQVQQLRRSNPPFELILSETPYSRNRMLLLDPVGAVLGAYDKMELVPFSEYTPKWFKGIAPSRYQFQPGPSRQLLHSSHGRILPLICYEIITPGRLTGPFTEADLIINTTSDTWFNSERQAIQHFYLARGRCIEMRLPMVRASNSGVSAHVDRLGRIEGATPVGTTATPIYTVLCGDGRTSLYARFGDVTWLAAYLLVVASWRFSRRRNGGREGN
jgi:apolipoprotein N-acyltransferase